MNAIIQQVRQRENITEDEATDFEIADALHRQFQDDTGEQIEFADFAGQIGFAIESRDISIPPEPGSIDPGFTLPQPNPLPDHPLPADEITPQQRDMLSQPLETGVKPMAQLIGEAIQARQAASRDDMGTVLKKTAQNAPERFQRQIGGAMEKLGTKPEGYMEPENFPPTWFDSLRAVLEPTGIADKGKQYFDEATAEIEANAPNVKPGSKEFYAHSILSSIIDMGPAVAVTMITKGKAGQGLGTSIFTSQVFGEKYAEARRSGRSDTEATQDAMFYAATEGLSEAIPLGILTRPGGNFALRFLKSSAAEGIQEVFNELAQIGYDKFELSEDISMQEALRRLWDAGVIGAGAGGGLTVVTHPVAKYQEWKAKQQGPDLGEAQLKDADQMARESLRPDQTPLEQPKPAGGVMPAAKEMPTPNLMDMEKNPEYWAEKKGKVFTESEMTPDEYLQKTAEGFGKPVEQTIADTDEKLVNKYAEDMAKGDKFPKLILDYTDGFSQEGRHRALAAKKAGFDSVPVITIDKPSVSHETLPAPDGVTYKRDTDQDPAEISSPIVDRGQSAVFKFDTPDGEVTVTANYAGSEGEIAGRETDPDDGHIMQFDIDGAMSSFESEVFELPPGRYTMQDLADAAQDAITRTMERRAVEDEAREKRISEMTDEDMGIVAQELGLREKPAEKPAEAPKKGFNPFIVTPEEITSTMPEDVEDFPSSYGPEIAAKKESLWFDIGDGYQARAYTVEGRPYQEIKSPKGDIYTRAINSSGQAYGELEGDGSTIFSKAPFKSFEGLFDRYKRTKLEQGATTKQTPANKSSQQLYAVFNGQKFPVSSVEDASAKWRQFRHESGAGVRAIGNGVDVVDGAGKVVATVSYNGRMWTPDGQEIKPAIEQPAKPKAKPAEKPTQAPKQQGDEKLATKFKDIADRMENTIQGKLNPAVAQQNATPRRAGIIDSMQSEGRRLQKIQGTMYALAEAARAGTIPKELENVNSRADIEMFQRSKPYGPAWREDGGYKMKEFMEVTKGLRGSKDAREVLRLSAGPLHTRTAEAIETLIKLVKKYRPGQAKYTLQDLSEDVRTWKRYKRLGLLDEKTKVLDEDKWYAAKEAIDGLQDKAPKPSAEDLKKQKIDQLERNLVGQKGIGVDYFPTPKAVAERMVEMAGISEGMQVLEPSAGKGNIADVIAEAGVMPDVVEQSHALREILEAKGYDLVGSNFLDYSPGQKYDAIVMNPPFSKNMDIEHIQHAYSLLKPGGTVVALSSPHWTFANDQASKDFRDFIEINNGQVEDIEGGGLADKKVTQRSNVNGRLITLVKPKAKTAGTAPEHNEVGVDDRELGEIVGEFNDAQAGMMEGEQEMTTLFVPPKKSEVVRLADKVKVYNKKYGWMTPKEAAKKIDEWEKNALDQYNKNGKARSQNGQRVVVSLFDLTGKWSLPWEQAGYEVFRFDIQDGWGTAEVDGRRINPGDVHEMGHDFFAEIFGSFEGKDVYAVLAACPCTDFASSGARHFAAKDADGRTVASVKLVHQTLNVIEYLKPAIWAIENPVGRIEKLGGLPPWRLSFDPNHLGETYTKKTLIWGRFNADLPIAPVEPTEGSKMHKKYGGKSMATKNARSATPEGFAYGFFQANNAWDHPVMAIHGKFDRLDRGLIQKAVDAGVTEAEITEAVEDFYYQDLDDESANDAIRDLTAEKSGTPPAEKSQTPGRENSMTPGANYAGRADQPIEAREIEGAKKVRKIQRRDDALKPLLKSLKLPLYYGRIGKRSYVAGYYLPRREAVRVKEMNDIEVATHEIAHLIDDITWRPDSGHHKGTQPWYRGNHPKAPIYMAELKSVSYDKTKPWEGFAEFVRLWATQPDAAKAGAPEFYKWFEDFVTTWKHGKALRESKARMLAWYAQPAVDRGASKIGGDVATAVNDVTASFWDNSRQAIFDDLNGVRRMIMNLDGDMAVYEEARQMRAAHSIVDGALMWGPPKRISNDRWDYVDRDGNSSVLIENGKIIANPEYKEWGLDDVLSPVDKELGDWVKYAVGMSAAELMEQGRENLFTKAEIQSFIRLGDERPHFLEVFNDYQKWNKRLLDFAEDMGILSKEARAKFRRNMYLPFYRVGRIVGTKRKKGIPGNVKPIHMLTGGTENLNNILENMIVNASTLITEGIKNQARLRIADYANNTRGGGRFMVRIPKDVTPVSVDSTQVKSSYLENLFGMTLGQYKQLKKAGALDVETQATIDKMLDTMDANMDEYTQFWQFGQAPKGDNVVAVLRDGKPEYYEVIDPLLYRSFTSFNRRQIQGIEKAFNSVRRLGQSSITLTMDFMTANIWRDTIHGWVFSKHGFKPVIGSMSGMKSRIARDPAYKAYIANGGGMASYLVDPKAFENHVKRYYQKAGVDFKSVMHTPGKVLLGLELLADAFETSTRIGEFKAGIARGGAPRRVAYDTREVSVDFSMRGDNQWINWAFNTIIFLKAGMNSMDRFYRGVTKDPNKGSIFVKSGAIAAASVLIYLINRGNPDYEDQEDWLKDLHWHVILYQDENGAFSLRPFYKGQEPYQHMKFPKIWEIGAIASAAERTMELYLDKVEDGYADGKKYAKRLATIFMDLFKLEYIPHLAEPLIETYWLNKERFTDRPIETEEMKGLLPYARYNEYTNKGLVDLAAMTADMPPALQFSPAKAEALIRGYLNTWGFYGLMLEEQISQGDKLPTLQTGQMPVARRFIVDHPLHRTVYETEFWELYRETAETYNTMNKMVKTDKPELAEIHAETEEAQLYKTMERVRKQAGQIRDNYLQVYHDEDLSPDVKRRYLNELTRQKGELFKDIMTSLEGDKP